MSKPVRDILMAFAGGLVVLGLCGCETMNKTHAENKAEAEARWKRVRSALILQMAQQQFDTGDLKEAQKTLRDALAIDPQFAQSHVLAGRIELEHGKLERSYQQFEMAVQLDAKLAEGFFYQGVVLQRWRRFEHALLKYQKAYELVPDNAGYFLAAGEMLVALDRADDALALFLDKADYFDQNAGLRMAIGQIYFMKRDYPRALEYYRRAVTLRPDELPFQEDLGYAQLASGEAVDAVSTFERLLAKPDYRDRRDLRFALGNALVAAERLNDAKELFLQLARRETTDSEAWLKVAETSWALDDLTGALLAAQRFATLSPRRPEGFLMAGMVYEKRGQIDQALRMFDRAAHLDPADATAVILRGVVLQKAGRKAAAARAYSDALRRSPGDARATQLLAGVSE